MANRVKEDERNERTIRNLLKLPDNRRCVNCNSLGPQYVCINFWTFICTTCSGIHREFTHRVKSVSMAKFTSQEVSALQGGGNASAKEIYFKEWDSQRHSLPDTSNVERLRDFIKHVYVERRYTGERSFDKPPRVKTGEAENSYERRTDTYQGSRSPPYEDTYERRYSDRTSPGGRSDDSYRNSNDERSPGYDQESRQYGSDYRRSPARTEIVNDWRREDRFGNVRNSEDGRSSDGSSKLEGRSPDRQKDFHMSSPPVVRPVRDILGDNVSPLRIIEPPKANGGRATDGSLRTQRTTSSSSLTSSNGNPAELKREDSGILIDFDAVPETPIAAMPERQQAATNQSVAQPTTSSHADNWACFDSAPAVKISQASTNANSLESLLSQLSVPPSVPAQTTAFPGVSGVLETAAVPSASNSQGAPVGKMSILPNLTNFPSVSAPGAAPAGHTSMFPFEVGARVAAVNSLTPFPAGGVPVGAPGLASGLPSNGVNSFVSVAVEGQWPSMPPIQHSLFPNQSTAQPFNLPVGQSSSNQPWNGSIASNAQGPFGIPEQSSQAFSKPVAEVTSGVITESSSVEAKPSGRNELPENLFTVTYPSYAPVHGWQTGPPRGFEFNMHYNTAMPTLPFPQPSKSSNPFDFNNEVSPVQAPMFPSMASLHGALPNAAAPAGILHTSSLGTPSPSWTPSQSSYLPAILTQAPSFTSAAHPSAYTGQQQVHSNLPSRPQGAGGFSSDGATLGSIANQQLSGIYSAPATSNTFSSVSGNPFG